MWQGQVVSGQDRADAREGGRALTPAREMKIITP